MELIRDLEAVAPRYRGCALTVGVFDGVHVGHQRVVGRTVARAEALGAAALVFTFHPHPREVLNPAEAPPLVQTFGQKLEILRQLGVAAVIWPRDMQGLLALAPEAFFDQVVVGSLGARAIVEGSDFRFGAGGAGDDAMLRRLAANRGIDVELVEHVTVGGERVSSTRIRRLIIEGRVAEAAECLGRPYTYIGTVVEGHHRGGTLLGYPTANVEAPRFLLPAQGVYAGWATVRGRRCQAGISVGTLPTFHRDHPVVVEAFLLDFEGELYGEQVALDFIEYLRPQAAFASPEALRRQLEIDCGRVRAVLAPKP
jgi:riboflavin kinase / FMN adenylyltransferase